MTIDKTYQPASVEGRIYAAWEAAGAFRAGRPERAEAEPYCIVIPPPNVTGSLHMGHALNNTLQDILCRFERMRGKDVLWQPGTDHAGIATQAVVERQLMERQERGSREMGREAFIKRVWEWKAESGGAIIGQLKRLGASCDWSRERFTMDEGLSRAVAKVFVELYREGLIYKDKRLVNWDPKLKTAISDLEVVQVETKGHLWHLRYPLESKTFNPEDPSTFIVVATTRPETMLGDSAVAVHPDDERYKDYVAAFKAGKPVNVILPLVGRKIPIIADEYSDPEKGSGAVKITPAHDFNDFEVGKRRNLRAIKILNIEAKVDLVSNADENGFFEPTDFDIREIIIGSNSRDLAVLRDRVADKLAELHRDQEVRVVREFSGMDRFVARKKIVALLEEQALVEKIEPHSLSVPHGDRSNVVIEPFLTDQWYVNAHELAKPAIAAVRDGKTKFVPANWETTYFNWMESIQPWCISRQLWWGHHIPAWYGFELVGENQLSLGKVKIFVAESEAIAVEQAREHYRSTDVTVVANDRQALDDVYEGQRGQPLKRFAIWRDEDVLDTWFSSALWPFSTLGWPDETPELKRYYPTSVLVTGFDIIFFWVARMIMMGIHFMWKERPNAPLEKVVPFPTVYIHALVRDATGAKMSKSKGNVIDPLELIDQYGADALRFTLAAMAAQGRDIKLSAERVAGYRNFATKLWNAARFAEVNGCAISTDFDPLSTGETINRWIIHETANAAGVIEWKIKEYKFNDAAMMAYRYVWNLYCDWYLELAKPVLLGPDGPAKDETRATIAWARDEILKLLHPFMPFITEELWGITEQRSHLLALTKWPELRTRFGDGKDYSDAGAEAEIGWLIDLISTVRSARAEMKITAQIPLVLVNASLATREFAKVWAEFIKRLARISEISLADTVPQGSVQLVVRGEVVALPVKGAIDLVAEQARLAKELQKADADIARLDSRLNNPRFLEGASEDFIEEEKEKREEAQARKAKIAEALERLQGAA